jgi:hypothetical protein
MKFNSYQNFKKIDMLIHTCNPSTEEGEAGGSQV